MIAQTNDKGKGGKGQEEGYEQGIAHRIMEAAQEDEKSGMQGESCIPKGQKWSDLRSSIADRL